MSHDPFYFQSIRKYTVLFGSLFDDIRIIRNDSSGSMVDLIKVPITYGPRDKMLARVEQDPNISRQTAIQLPIMSFEMIGMEYDGARKLPATNRMNVPSSITNVFNSQYTPVPYNIGYALHVYVKNAEDGLKIIEQILPYFTPDYTLKVNLIPETNIIIDVPIVLDKVELDDKYEGSFKERRALIWTLTFTLKANIYGPVANTGVILFADTNFYVTDSTGATNRIITTTVQPGLTANGQPTSNAAQSVPANTISVTSDYGFIETITGEH